MKKICYTTGYMLCKAAATGISGRSAVWRFLGAGQVVEGHFEFRLYKNKCIKKK